MRHAVASAWPLSDRDRICVIWPEALAASITLARHPEDEMVAARCARCIHVTALKPPCGNSGTVVMSGVLDVSRGCRTRVP
jgi:hypothetical protein